MYDNVKYDPLRFMQIFYWLVEVEPDDKLGLIHRDDEVDEHDELYIVLMSFYVNEHIQLLFEYDDVDIAILVLETEHLVHLIIIQLVEVDEVDIDVITEHEITLLIDVVEHLDDEVVDAERNEHERNDVIEVKRRLG